LYKYNSVEDGKKKEDMGGGVVSVSLYLGGIHAAK
jgi:hypothetical protein